MARPIKIPANFCLADITVDPSTGMITLRAQFPNPDHILLPGMFARVQLEQAVDQDAISVPQRAVALGGKWFSNRHDRDSG